MSKHKKPETKQTPTLIYIVAAGFAALIGFLAVYGTFAPKGNGEQQAAVKTSDQKPATTGNIKDLNQGSMAGFVFRHAPKDVPEITFNDGSGEARKLSDWKGKVVLLNLWATWCAPCRKEMPALDELQAKLGSDDFEVVALSVDRAGLDKPRDFLKKIKINSLALYNDPSAKMASKLKVMGMPTTLLIDRDGKEIGRLTGPAHWNAAEAVTLVKAVIDGGSS